MKRILLTFFLACGFLVSVPTVAQAGIADCISMGYPSVSSSSTSIRMSVSMTVNCSKSQLGTGGGPLYSIESENNLTSNCSGPYSLYQGSSGTITCTINIGSSSGSSRSGATSSTIKIWFAYDFSTKYISFSHSPIPRKNSGGSNGCSVAPNVPSLSWSQLDNGIAFSVTASSVGDRATSIYYSYAYFDESRLTWDPWSNWFGRNVVADIPFNALIGNNKTKIAFAAYASNDCGSSIQIRESTNNLGLYLLPSLDPVVAKAAAELKAKQEAEAKAAAELKAKQEAEAAVALKAKQEADARAAAAKKTTIICIKAKLIKNVTAVKPKCPSGYKVKK